MSQILDTVTAQLRADTAQFEAGFEQSAVAVALLERHTVSITPALNRMEASTRSAAKAVRDLNVAASSATGHAIAAFNGVADNVSEKLPPAERVLNSFRRGVANLAFQAAGLPGPLGKMSEALLMFAGGSALVLAVTAGIGLIALAYNKLAQAAEDSEKIARDAAARFTEHLKTIAGFGDAQRDNLVPKIKELKASIAALQANRFMGQLKLMEATDEELRQIKELEQLEASLLRLNKERAKVAQEEADERHLQAIIEDNERLIPLLELERDLMDDIRKMQADLAARAVPGMPTSPFGGLPLAGDDALFDRMARDVESQTSRIFGDPELLEDIQDLGISAGRQFALGIIEGMQDFEDIIKRVALTILDFFITKGITSILKPASAVSDVSGGGLAAMAPASGTTLNVSVGPPMTPFDIARDAQWQRALRESITVARSQGFK